LITSKQFFNFHNTNLENVVVLPSTASQILLQRDSNLLAIVCDDLVIRIVDIETHRVVRELTGFRGRILDIVRSLIVFQNCVLTALGRPSRQIPDG